MDVEIRKIIDELLIRINPYDEVINALKKLNINKKVAVIAVGKAAYVMGKAASDYLSDKISFGVILTKYHYLGSPIDKFEMYEAGHPLSDENSFIATKRILDLTKNLDEDLEVVFLLSGGASALFELSKVDLNTLKKINNDLLKCGATIDEINIIRKRLSYVKAGKFAKHLYPNKVYSIIISDVVSKDLSTIGSGPCAKDISSYEDVLRIINKYSLDLSKEVLEYLKEDNVSEIDNVENHIISDVEKLCLDSKDILEKMNYDVSIVSDKFNEDMDILVNIFKDLLKKNDKNKAYIIGGEPTLVVKGMGLGGRCEEFCLRMIKEIKDYKNVKIFALGSDGTDGPTDAAGAYIDNNSYSKINDLGLNLDDYLNNNDSYHLFEKLNHLIKTGSTGTNINDLYVMMVKENE